MKECYNPSGSGEKYSDPVDPPITNFEIKELEMAKKYNVYSYNRLIRRYSWRYLFSTNEASRKSFHSENSSSSAFGS